MEVGDEGRGCGLGMKVGDEGRRAEGADGEGGARGGEEEGTEKGGRGKAQPRAHAMEAGDGG